MGKEALLKALEPFIHDEDLDLCKEIIVKYWNIINSPSKKKEFILVQDDSLHWFVIPSDREDVWVKWLKGEVSPCPLPDYADPVGFYNKPNLVKFSDYKIEKGG